jgi:flagellar biosynthesis protein
VAKGQGAVAERILAVAREHGVPAYTDTALVDVLSRLNLDDEIPVELWMVVAEILIFLRRAEDAARSGG